MFFKKCCFFISDTSFLRIPFLLIRFVSPIFDYSIDDQLLFLCTLVFDYVSYINNVLW